MQRPMRQRKLMEDNFSAQRFENAFQTDLSLDPKQCGSSGAAAFFAMDMQALINSNFEMLYPIWRNLHRDFSRPVLWQNLSNETFFRFDLFGASYFRLGYDSWRFVLSFMQGNDTRRPPFSKLCSEKHEDNFMEDVKMDIDIWFPVLLDYFGLTAGFLVIFPLQLILFGEGKCFRLPFYGLHILRGCVSRLFRVCYFWWISP